MSISDEWPTREQRVRIAALQWAVETFGNDVGSYNDEAILDTADKYENFILNGRGEPS